MSVFLEVKVCQRDCDHRLSTAVLDDQVTLHWQQRSAVSPQRSGASGSLKAPVPQPTPDTASPLLYRTVGTESPAEQAQGLVLGNEGAQGR